MAKCLVTGVAGFIASHVADLLIEEGHEVIGVDNLSTGELRNVNKKVRFIQEDIRTLPQYHLEGVEYVFHLASLARIQPSIERPYPHHDVNVNGSLKLMEYCRRRKIKFIFSSSSSIYKNDKLPTGEGANRHPLSPYAMQKYVVEEYIKLYGSLYGMPYAILRYFNVFGERQILEGTYAAIVGIFLNQRSKGEQLTIVGDGEQRRDFTYVKDVARANLMAMGWSGVYNIGTGTNHSINELADRVGGEKVYLPARAGEYRATLADIRRARAKGWQPTVDIVSWIDAQG